MLTLKRPDLNERGFTLVELTVGFVVVGIIAGSMLMLYAAMVSSELLNKRKAVASTLATNQMEYLKSLPYNNLAVAGGSIVSSNPLPASTKKVLNGYEYNTITSINYVDDAYDGCGNYPSQVLKEAYCRNYPAPSGAPAVDTNRADYKIIHVAVYGPTNVKFAEVDSQVSARVAETASTTGALFVTVIDNTGNPLSGAAVSVTNNTLVPSINVSDNTDSNGNAVFYGLPPDTIGYDYVVSASLNNYSSITTIAPSGSLQPNYSSQRIFTQLSSLVTLTLKPQGANSLLVETTNVSGNPIGNVKVNLKGGYKKYSNTTDTSYYYDAISPTDIRSTTNGSGIVGVRNLVPGSYVFCGDLGATGCSIGGTTYYLAAAVPYGVSNSFNPIIVPTFSADSPPSITYAFEDASYLQKVRLILTNNASFPRIQSVSPSDVSIGGGTIGAFGFQISGVNLPCSSAAASCQTSVRLVQGSNNFIATCTGNASGLTLDCTVNMTGANVGVATLVITSNGNTLSLPGSPLLGGVNVTP